MFNKRLITLVPLLALSACMHQADNPRDVASRYWQAMKAGDTASARELVSRVSQQDFDSYLAIPDEGKTAIGDIKLGAEQATVVTILHAQDSTPQDNTPQVNTAGDVSTFDTVLVLEDGAWKIDATQTTVPRPAPSDRELDELADQLSESMEENIESIEDAMKEGMDMLNEALREGSRDMGESMLKGMEEMNKALRESIDEMQQRRQQSKPEDGGEGLL